MLNSVTIFIYATLKCNPFTSVEDILAQHQLLLLSIRNKGSHHSFIKWKQFNTVFLPLLHYLTCIRSSGDVWHHRMCQMEGIQGKCQTKTASKPSQPSQVNCHRKVVMGVGIAAFFRTNLNSFIRRVTVRIGVPNEKETRYIQMDLNCKIIFQYRRKIQKADNKMCCD